LPDQGDKKVRDEPGYAEAADDLGDRLQIVDQPNLGGSGGYSRIMYEARRRTDAPYILYMDDDIEIEPDSILRALAFGRYARVPMLVGGQMLNLQERSHLHTMGEVVGPHDFMWTAAPHSDYDYDFSRHPLTDRENPKELHRRVENRSAPAVVHQVGRGRVRPARPPRRTSHGVDPRGGDLAHGVVGQARRDRLAGLFPPPQPPRGGLAVPRRRPQGHHAIQSQ